MSNRASFIFGRALPLGVFGFLVAIQGELAFAGVQHALTHGGLDRAGSMYLLNRVLTVAFFAFLVAIYAIRSKAWVLAGSDLCLAVGMILALYSLTYLGKRFSIVPEARGLITSGPYHLIRHPIYLGEIIAGVGLILPTLFSLHLALFAVFLAAQIVRTVFEERILRSTYPQYEAYAAHTRRLIPFVF